MHAVINRRVQLGERRILDVCSDRLYCLCLLLRLNPPCSLLFVRIFSVVFSIALRNQMCGLPRSKLGWFVTSSLHGLSASCISFIADSKSLVRDSSWGAPGRSGTTLLRLYLRLFLLVQPGAFLTLRLASLLCLLLGSFLLPLIGADASTSFRVAPDISSHNLELGRKALSPGISTFTMLARVCVCTCAVVQ